MAQDVSSDSPTGFATPADDVKFEQFTRRLIGLARAHLDKRMQYKVDPEDVVQSAYKSFILRYGSSKIASQGMDSFWSLLTLITLRKCADRARYFKAECRSLSREALAAGIDERNPWRDTMGREPTPEHAAVMAETVEQLLSGLAPAERPVIELSLQGYSTQEVCQRLGRAERTVRRLRERLRKQLERLQADRHE